MVPNYMTTWIVVQISALFLEIVLWIIDMAKGQSENFIYTLISFLLIYGNWICLNCVRSVLQNALDNGKYYGFSLL